MPTANEADIRVAPLELFFDLVFVFAITQIAGLMRQEPTPAGIAKGALVLAMIYWGWSMFTWTLNALGTERLDVRLALVAAMAMSLLMARVIPEAFGDGGPISRAPTSCSDWRPIWLPSWPRIPKGAGPSGPSSPWPPWAA